MLRIVVGTSKYVVVNVCPQCQAKFITHWDDNEMFSHETFMHNRGTRQEPVYVNVESYESPALLLPGQSGKAFYTGHSKREAQLAELAGRHGG